MGQFGRSIPEAISGERSESTIGVPQAARPDTTRGRPAMLTGPVTVEVAGIEPASSVASTGLLRAQCAVSLLGPTDHAHKSV